LNQIKDKFFIPEEKEHYQLQEPYVFNYSYGDGFTMRLLSIDILIDIDFNCSLQLSSCEEIPIAHANGYSVIMETRLPKDVELKLKRYIESLELKKSETIYDTNPGITGVPMYRFIYGDLSGKSKAYVYDLYDDEAVTKAKKAKKLRLEIQSLIIEWTNKMYEAIKEAYNV
jgi:hypothetical protein